jgi:hypothetical protein
MSEENPHLYDKTIRDAEFLGPLVGAKVVDVTQHDKAEWLVDGISFVMLHFDNGYTIRFDITEENPLTVTPPGDDDDTEFDVTQGVDE